MRVKETRPKLSGAGANASPSSRVTTRGVIALAQTRSDHFYSRCARCRTSARTELGCCRPSYLADLSLRVVVKGGVVEL